MTKIAIYKKNWKAAVYVILKVLFDFALEVQTPQNAASDQVLHCLQTEISFKV